MKKDKIPTTQLVTGNVPFEFSEAYKALRTNFNFVSRNGENRKILITSAIPNEGKTSITINLAISLVQTGKKVLVVDTDMRNPTLHIYLNLKRDREKGLSAALIGGMPWEDCVVETLHGFDVIHGGPIPPNPAELVASKDMQNILNSALEQYDYVLCDAPPVGIVTDAAALSTLCDGVLFVVRQKMGKKNQIMGAVHKLQSVNAKILGVVLNHYDMSDVSEKEYGYYSNYYK